MKLLPIETDPAANQKFRNIPECVEILDIFTEYYKKIGYNPPWIGYFVADEQDHIMGGGAFKGQPRDGKVEISYGTFKYYQGQGVATQICRTLVNLSLQTAPGIRITARTLPDNLASIGVLKRNGFECLGLVFDEEDGDVLEWEYKKSSPAVADL